MWVLYGLCFIFSNFYRLDLHDETCVALTNLQRRIDENRNDNQISFGEFWILEVHACQFLNSIHKVVSTKTNTLKYCIVNTCLIMGIFTL